MGSDRREDPVPLPANDNRLTLRDRPGPWAPCASTARGTAGPRARRWELAILMVVALFVLGAVGSLTGDRHARRDACTVAELAPWALAYLPRQAAEACSAIKARARNLTARGYQ